MAQAGVRGAGGGDLIETLKIVGFSMLTAVLYGVAHDMVTAHLSLEYFTVAHPPLISTENPVLLALGWGVATTWWVGLILGVALALASRAGSRPVLALADVRRSIVRLMLVSAITAVLAGLVGVALAIASEPPIGMWAEMIAPDRQARFAGALFAHSASYLVGCIGGIVICVAAWRKRGSALPPHSSSSMSQ
ncbi:hypothetical protein [Aurantiacibacter gilvus]|uniref:Uncharacterized protein n=1 Tax=Aurantiacibacter gilvus TaxID=3139141 RepID=A0ABU9IIX0_9SPHN